MIISIYFLSSEQVHAESIKLTNPIDQEIIDASQPYLLSGEQEGISEWSIELEPIIDTEICHNNTKIVYQMPQGKFPSTFIIQSTTTSFQQIIDFTPFADYLSEKISFKMHISKQYRRVLLDEKIIKFKNVPGKDWCEWTYFTFTNLSSNGAMPAKLGEGLGRANFGFNATGVEKVIMDYGDGIITEFPVKNMYLAAAGGLFPHDYQKTGNYTVTARVYNFKGDMLERKINITALSPENDPTIYIDTPTQGIKINGNSDFNIVWHSKNYQPSEFVNIRLYTFSPERTDLIARLAHEIPNSGQKILRMPSTIPNGQYLLKVYCTNTIWPYCNGASISIEKIDNIVTIKNNFQPVINDTLLPGMIQSAVTTTIPVKVNIITPQDEVKIDQVVVSKKVPILEPLKKKVEPNVIEIKKALVVQGTSTPSIKVDVLQGTTVTNFQVSTDESIKSESIFQLIISRFKKLFSF